VSLEDEHQAIRTLRYLYKFNLERSRDIRFTSEARDEHLDSGRQINNVMIDLAKEAPDLYGTREAS